MSRIRTIKPEFWTDEKIVRLPFEARLLFIGLWNFADDTGAIDLSPDRIRMQIFPGDQSTDVAALIDLLAAAELVDYWVSEDNENVAIVICNWLKHQKIDNPSKKSIIREGYRKFAIPNSARIAVATKYGCQPGGTSAAECFYCGFPGKIYWHKTHDGRPTRWVTLGDLEFDHFMAEFTGGKNDSSNIVLACQTCNRGKRDREPHKWFEKKNPSIILDRTIEPSPLEGKGMDQGKEREKDIVAQPREVVSRETEKPSRPREWFEKIEGEAREAAGLDNDPSPALFDVSPIVSLIDAGYDFARDILPPLRKARASGKHGASWRYYVPMITEGKDANGKIAPKLVSTPSANQTIWITEDDPRWRDSARLYETAKGKKAVAMGSRHESGIGFPFPADCLPDERKTA